MFDRRKPFKSQRGGTQRVQSAAGHWHNGKWFPASAGRAGPDQRGQQQQRAHRAINGNGNGGRNGAGRGRSSYDSGNFSDGETGMARRVGFRF